MPTPTINYWQVTSISGGDSIALLNQSGGPQATQLTSSPFDLADVEAGLCAPPQILLIEFVGSTAQALDFKMYDTGHNRDSPIVDSQGDDLFASYSNDPGSWSGNYNIHYDLKKNYINPATISTSPGSSPIDSWGEVLYGGNPIRLDTSSRRPSPGNDNTTGLLVTRSGISTNHLVNFFIYLSMKPKSSATAGEHLGFGSRLSFVYP